MPRQHAGAEEEAAEEEIFQTQAKAAVSVGAELRGAGVIICDQFAMPAQIRSLRDCAESRRSQGEFAPARIGGRAASQRREDVRGDSTCWLQEPLYPAERGLLEQFEELRLQLNRDAFLGLFDLEMHYAWYPPGAGYNRHVDQPQGRAQRLVSLVLYLNLDWDPLAGGLLRIYDAAERTLDIEPIAGRLVCFLTAGREHAVLPASRDRFSISGWFRARD
jgi:SM-20-related protein